MMRIIDKIYENPYIKNDKIKKVLKKEGII